MTIPAAATRIEVYTSVFCRFGVRRRNLFAKDIHPDFGFDGRCADRHAAHSL